MTPNNQAIKLLKEIEWCGLGEKEDYCPICRGFKSRGHSKYCNLPKLLFLLSQPKCKTCGDTRKVDFEPDDIQGDIKVPCPDCQPECKTCGGTGQIGEEEYYQGRSVGWKACPDCQPKCETCLMYNSCPAKGEVCNDYIKNK